MENNLGNDDSKVEQISLDYWKVLTDIQNEDGPQDPLQIDEEHAYCHQVQLQHSIKCKPELFDQRAEINVEESSDEYELDNVTVTLAVECDMNNDETDEEEYKNVDLKLHYNCSVNSLKSIQVEKNLATDNECNIENGNNHPLKSVDNVDSSNNSIPTIIDEINAKKFVSIKDENLHYIEDDDYCFTCSLLHQNNEMCEEHMQQHKLASTSHEDNSTRIVKSFEKCTHCFSSFKNVSALKRHLKFCHSDLFKFVCSDCQETFQLQEELIKHFKIHHRKNRYGEPINEIFNCGLCHVSFNSKSRINEHYKIHYYECGDTINNYVTTEFIDNDLEVTTLCNNDVINENENMSDSLLRSHRNIAAQLLLNETSNSSISSTKENAVANKETLNSSKEVKSNSRKKSKICRQIRKRLQNRNAACRYRQRKKDEILLLEKEYQDTLEYNKKLHRRISNIMTELKTLKNIMRDYYRNIGLLK